MKRTLLFLLLAIFLTSCFFKTKDNKENKEPQETKEVKETKDDNMKWTAKYNFLSSVSPCRGSSGARVR